MKKKIELKLFICLVLILMVTFTLIGNVYAEIGDSGTVLENGEETTQNLLGGVTLHEQDLKFLWDCSGNYYYEFDTQYLETQPNSEGVKIVTWSYRNEGEWKMAGVSDIAENFEKNNPGWIVVGGTNADFFNIDGNGAMVGNAMEMGELIHPERENLNPTWRGILGFTKEGKFILGKMSAEEALNKGIVEAMEYGPFLVVNGKPSFIKGNGGWGIAPRTAIGQRQDGIVLFLIIDGRQTHSIGADMVDLAEIMVRYKAYNAVNLDGGSSTALIIDNKIINKPTANKRTGLRYIPTAFIVTE
jgi:hypothetical protein